MRTRKKISPELAQSVEAACDAVMSLFQGGDQILHGDISNPAYDLYQGVKSIKSMVSLHFAPKEQDFLIMSRLLIYNNSKLTLAAHYVNVLSRVVRDKRMPMFDRDEMLSQAAFALVTHPDHVHMSRLDVHMKLLDPAKYF